MSRHCDETLLSDVTMTSHDVAMTTLLHVSDLNNTESQDNSFSDADSDTDTLSMDFPESMYSTSEQMTSLRYYGNIEDHVETSCCLSDDDYSASFTHDANNDITKQHATKTSRLQPHPRFLDTSFISAQLSDDHYTPTPNRRHLPKLPISSRGRQRSNPTVTTPALWHQRKVSTANINGKLDHFAKLKQKLGVSPTGRQGRKRKLTSRSETSSGSSLPDDNSLQVLRKTV